MVGDDIESETEVDDKDESTGSKCCGYMVREIGDSDGCIGK